MAAVAVLSPLGLAAVVFSSRYAVEVAALPNACGRWEAVVEKAEGACSASERKGLGRKGTFAAEEEGRRGCLGGAGPWPAW